MENFKEQATRLQKCTVENWILKKAFLLYTKLKLESWKLLKQKKKKNEYYPPFLLKLEDLKEQVKFLENKEQLDNFKNNKIQLFKKGQYSNSTHAA